MIKDIVDYIRLEPLPEPFYNVQLWAVRGKEYKGQTPVFAQECLQQLGMMDRALSSIMVILPVGYASNTLCRKVRNVSAV